MTSRLALAVFAATLALASAVRAQEPQQPVEDDTPTMTTDDVTPAPTISRPTSSGGPGATRMLESFYAKLASNGVSAADVAGVRARIDGGGELTTGVLFDVGNDGRVQRPSIDRSSGFPSFDATLSRELTKDPGRLELLAGYTGVRILITVARGGIHIRAGGAAPTVERATALESLVVQLRERAPKPENVSIRRDGSTLSFEVSMPFDE